MNLLIRSFISPEEAMAAGTMRCQAATIPHNILTKLSTLQYDGPKQSDDEFQKPSHPYKDAAPLSTRLTPLLKTDPLSPSGAVDTASNDTQWLANGGDELAKAILADPATKKRLDDALGAFIDAENRSKALIEEILSQV
jgi:transaldolase